MGFMVLQLGLPVDMGVMIQTQAAWAWHLLHSSYSRLLFEQQQLVFIERVNVNLVV